MGQDRGRVQQGLWHQLQPPELVQEDRQHQAEGPTEADGGEEEKPGKPCCRNVSRLLNHSHMSVVMEITFFN